MGHPPIHVLSLVFFMGVCGLALLLPALEMLVRNAAIAQRSQIGFGAISHWQTQDVERSKQDSEALVWTPFVNFVTKDGIEATAQVEPPFRRAMTTHYPPGSLFGFRYLPESPERGFDIEWDTMFKKPAYAASAGVMFIACAMCILWLVS